MNLITINSLLLCYFTILANPIVIEGKPFVLAVPLISLDQIKAFFSSLTNESKVGSGLAHPPSVARIIDSCYKSFTSEGEIIEPEMKIDQQYMDLSSPYFLYSSDNQTIIFSRVFSKLKNSNSPCPLDSSVCSFLTHIVTKDVSMSQIIGNLLDNYWESCMIAIDSVNNETSNDNESKNIHPSTERNDQVQIVE